MKVTLCCNVCYFEKEYEVELPFDCDTLECPGCGSGNSLSIIKVHEEPSGFNYTDVQRRLKRMKGLYAS